jgi:DNA-binding MarR family transcriptional regulator
VGSKRPDLRDQGADLLVYAAARLTRLENQVLANLAVPLTYRQHRILMRVAEGHTSPVVLASFGNLKLATMSECLSLLVRRGLVTRETNSQDRRAVVIQLTPAGRKASLAAQRALHKVFKDLLLDLPESQLEVLQEVLTSVYDKAAAHFPRPLVGPYAMTADG